MSMHLRHALATLVAASALAAAPTALAAELKIGFVNYQKLVQESPQARVANSALETEFAPRQREKIGRASCRERV